MALLALIHPLFLLPDLPAIAMAISSSESDLQDWDTPRPSGHNSKDCHLAIPFEAHVLIHRSHGNIHFVLGESNPA